MWQWWTSLSHPRQYMSCHMLRNMLQRDQALLHVRKVMLEELLEKCKLPRPDSVLPVGNDIVPKLFLAQRFAVPDHQPHRDNVLTYNRQDIDRMRGLGAQALFWQRMRSVQPCRTDLDLSAAMIATRDFSFQRPIEYDPSWNPYLQDYLRFTQPFAAIDPPSEQDYCQSIFCSKDSSPGPDGLPYAAWRVAPSVSAAAMVTHLDQVLAEQVPPPGLDPQSQTGPYDHWACPPLSNE